MRRLAEERPDILIGAGTVLDAETARMCILEGAQFVVSPALNLKTIELCHRYGVAVLPGALTPTEIVTAWEAGADVVKIFPASSLGGAKYLKSREGAAAAGGDDSHRRRLAGDRGGVPRSRSVCPWRRRGPGEPEGDRRGPSGDHHRERSANTSPLSASSAQSLAAGPRVFLAHVTKVVNGIVPSVWLNISNPQGDGFRPPAEFHSGSPGVRRFVRLSRDSQP